MKSKIIISIISFIVIILFLFEYSVIKEFNKEYQGIGLDKQNSILIPINAYYYDFKKFSLFNGIIIEKYKSGKTKSKMTIKDGLRNGTTLTYYENGNKEFLFIFQNDIANGIVKRWYQSGSLQAKVPYQNGKKNGLFEDWYENGIKKSEAYFDKGIRDGVVKHWDTNGNIKYVGIFINGELNGKFDSWHRNGNKFLSINIKKGKIYGDIKIWDENGKTMSYTKAIVLQKIEKIISNINNKKD